MLVDVSVRPLNCSPSSSFSPTPTVHNMRGLPFPSNALFNRELASEPGSPFSNVDDIPIDPALAGASAIDPAIAGDINTHSEGSQQVSLLRDTYL